MYVNFAIKLSRYSEITRGSCTTKSGEQKSMLHIFLASKHVLKHYVGFMEQHSILRHTATSRTADKIPLPFRFS